VRLGVVGVGAAERLVQHGATCFVRDHARLARATRRRRLLPFLLLVRQARVNQFEVIHVCNEALREARKVGLSHLARYFVLVEHLL